MFWTLYVGSKWFVVCYKFIVYNTNGTINLTIHRHISILVFHVMKLLKFHIMLNLIDNDTQVFNVLNYATTNTYMSNNCVQCHFTMVHACMLLCNSMIYAYMVFSLETWCGLHYSNPKSLCPML